MTFLAWDGFENVTQVWVLGATSTDDGARWGNFQEVDVPIDMEGQLTKGPDRLYYATRTGRQVHDLGY